ncbi:hypothetical protein [Salinibacterium sp.]|uniref:hypothetical protein n=1 Tax=Salinibacterium sp. TaxID=1915057 RepID=UPI00286BC8AA|nr:hypothetical protein [Salinibacterium sp.]
MENSLVLRRVPAELEYLSAEKSALTPLSSARALSNWSEDYREPARLSAAASGRLAQIMRLEASKDDRRVAHPAWLDGRAVPRLIVRARYNGSDVFGASRMMAQLDLAARRAGSIQRSLVLGEDLKGWPHPLRTHQGGLRLLDAQVGSLDLLMTVWGGLVTVATSAPIAVAGLIALSWDLKRGVVGAVSRWRASPLNREQAGRPSLEPPASSTAWGVKHTKELAPVLAQAVANDQGFEFFLSDGESQLKIVVLPKQSDPR